MDDLYEEDERENSSSFSVQKPVSVARMEDINPDQLISYKDNSRRAIIETTKLLSDKLKQCDQIVLNAWRVSDFVPNCDTKEQIETWKGKIIPILLKTINEDVVARLVMSDSFSAIRVLSITIQSAYEMIRTTKGSPEAIEIAKECIKESLDTIDKCIEKAKNLTDDGLKEFNKNSKTIMEMAGKEVAKKVMDMAEFEEKINKAREEENNFYSSLYKAEGDVIRYANLKDVVDYKRQMIKREMEEIQRQKSELNDMNKTIENKIQNIPQKSIEKRTVRSSSRSLWGLFSSSSEKVVDVEIDNPNKVSDQNYYDSIINARSSRVTQMDKTGDAKRAVLNDLDQQFVEYEEKLRNAEALVKTKNSTKEQLFKDTKEKIDYNKKEIEKLRKEAATLENTFGYKGQSLIDCLTQVKSFGYSLKDSTSAYSPIHSILKDIRAMVRLHVGMLLKTSNPQLVFIAGKELMQNVQFLSTYNLVAIEALKQSQGYIEVSKGIDSKIELLAIE